MSHGREPRRRAGGDGMARSLVPAAFDGGAAAYDRLVGANPGYHRHLRLSAARLGIPAGGDGMHLLDAGCGTGASTAALLSVAPRARITAIDASGEMLAHARRKAWPRNVEFIRVAVEDIDSKGPSGPFDGILAAYLIRNLADPHGQLRRMSSLLRPGAALAVHEYSVADTWWARAVWRAVCCGIIIPAGRLLTGDAALYRHLYRSVLAFDGADALCERLRAAGFDAVHRETMTGWQREIVHTFLARKPDEPGASR